jgi:hypothetical protein
MDLKAQFNLWKVNLLYQIADEMSHPRLEPLHRGALKWRSIGTDTAACANSSQRETAQLARDHMRFADTHPLSTLPTKKVMRKFCFL